MAGSYNHLVDENGKFTFELIENMGDAYEACEECFNIIQSLREACKYLTGWLHASTSLIEGIPKHLQPYRLIEKAEQAIAKAEEK